MTHPTLTILIPAFNEERRLPRLFDRLVTDARTAAASAGLELTETSSSTTARRSSTPQLLRPHPRRAGLARDHPRRRPGQGAAAKAGTACAHGERVLMTDDLDLSTPLDDLRLLLPRPGGRGSGNRVALGGGIGGTDASARAPREDGQLFNVLLRLMTGVPWRDTQCGFKLFKRERTQPLFELQRVDRFAFDCRAVRQRQASRPDRRRSSRALDRSP